MAVGVLQQNGDIGAKNLSDYGFVGELSLDGRLRECRGILPMIIAGQKKGVKKDNCTGSEYKRGMSGTWGRNFRIS